MPRPLHLPFSILSIFTAALAVAQTPGEFTSSAEYDAWKSQFIGLNAWPAHATDVNAAQRDGEEPCPCWIEPDDTYTTIALDQWDAIGWGNGDDGSYGPVALPFTVMLFGQAYAQVYISVNGNLTFAAPFSGYSAMASRSRAPA